MVRKEYEYRRNAVVSVELARRAACPADKAHLLKLAEAWLDLANLTHSQSGHVSETSGSIILSSGLSSGRQINGQRDGAPGDTRAGFLRTSFSLSLLRHHDPCFGEPKQRLSMLLRHRHC